MHGGEGSTGPYQGAKCASLSIVLKGMEVGDGMIRFLNCVFNQGHRGWEKHKAGSRKMASDLESDRGG